MKKGCVFCGSEDAGCRGEAALCEACAMRELPWLLAEVFGYQEKTVVAAKLRVIDALTKERLKAERYKKMRFFYRQHVENQYSWKPPAAKKK